LVEAEAELRETISDLGDLPATSNTLRGFLLLLGKSIGGRESDSRDQDYREFR
jgi:hypothetical protein